MAESGGIKPYLTSQDGPEVKYLLQGGMSGKKKLIGYILQASRYLIKMEICLEPM